MTSHYPPGVTGGEAAIAGYVEGSEARACATDTVAAAVPVHFLRELAAELRKDLPTPCYWADSLDQLAESAQDGGGLETECAFDGVVDVAYAPGLVLWTCPWCDGDHEDDDDPDD